MCLGLKLVSVRGAERGQARGTVELMWGRVSGQVRAKQRGGKPGAEPSSMPRSRPVVLLVTATFSLSGFDHPFWSYWKQPNVGPALLSELR